MEPTELSQSAIETKKRPMHRVTRACMNCQKSHLSCESTRPCKRCLERGKTCCDVESKRRGRKKKTAEVVEEEPENIPEEDYELAAQELAQLEYTFITSPISGIIGSKNDQKQEVCLVQNQPLDLPLELYSQILFAPMNRADSHSNIDVKEHDATNKRFDFFKKYREMSKIKCGDATFLERAVIVLRDHLANPKNTVITKDTLESMRKDFDNNVQFFKSTFDQVGVPTLIWDRCGVIHYVNQAYKKLVGFHEVLPTRLDSFGLIHELSSDGWKNYGESAFERSIVEPAKTTDSWIFSAGILVADTDKYIQGTMSVTIKRDVISIPILFLGNFLPLVQ